jgi:hypothetical protein
MLFVWCPLVLVIGKATRVPFPGWDRGCNAILLIDRQLQVDGDGKISAASNLEVRGEGEGNAGETLITR